jgi:hypothetical protein
MSTPRSTFRHAYTSTKLTIPWEGAGVGDHVGDMLGAVVGHEDGTTVGILDGTVVGFDGTSVGVVVGDMVGGIVVGCVTIQRVTSVITHHSSHSILYPLHATTNLYQ